MAKSNIERYKDVLDNIIRMDDKPTTYTQAERIIARFGSVTILHQRLMEIGLLISITAVYRWTYPKGRKGTGGLIPTRIWPYIMKAAILEGIVLVAEDFDPRPRF